MCAAAVGCRSTDDLWDALDELDNRVTAVEESVKKANDGISALDKLVKALQSRITIDSVEKTADGYTVGLSDGTTIAVSSQNGSFPGISVRQDEDSLYYWTLGGEYIVDEAGEKICASGKAGEPGASGITPQIRINDQTDEWEYSVDEGKTWISTGKKATGESGKGDSIFSDVQQTEESVIFTLADGETTIIIPKTAVLVFNILREGTGIECFKSEKTKSYEVESKGVADWMITAPAGWKAVFDGWTLMVTAPAGKGGEPTGEVAVMVTGAGGAGKIAKLPVSVLEFRILTFEDADYKGPEGAGYWTSLVDYPEYGGPMLYGEDMMDYEAEYEWADTGNTFLASGVVGDEDYEMYSFMLGGCAVSNYIMADIKGASYKNQLSVTPGADGRGGYDGSSNFCVCFDGSGMMGIAVSLRFSDGVSRTIDHMYVTNIAYTLNSLLNGGTMGEAPAGGSDWYKIVATGYDDDDSEIESAHPEFYLFRNGRAVTEWMKWDLSALGKVSYVEFRCEGSIKNSYGMVTPSYFAFDNVAVIMD